MALCRITGTVYLPNGQPAASQEIQFYKADTKIKADYLGAVLPDVVTVMTSPTGGIAVDLLTGYYKMYSKTDTITAFGKVTVPDALTANISDILVTEVLPEPNPVWLDQVQTARDESLDAAELSENAALDSALARDAANLAAGQASNTLNTSPVLPNNFMLGLNNWTSSRSGDPLTAMPTAKMTAYYDSTLGNSCLWQPTVVGDNILTKGVKTWGERPYKITVRLKVTVTVPGTISLNLMMSSMPANYQGAGYTGIITFDAVTDGSVITQTVTVSQNASDGADYTLSSATGRFARFGIRYNGGTATGISVVVTEISVEDATLDLKINSLQFGSLFSSRQSAIAATIPTFVQRISLLHDNEILEYVRLPASWNQSYAPLVTAGNQRWMPADLVTLKHFGAVADADSVNFTGTDCYAQLKLMMQFAEFNNAYVRRVHINRGKFLINKNSADINMRVNASYLRITGEGIGNSTFVFRNVLVDTTTARGLFYSAQAHEYLEMCDFDVISDWSLHTTYKNDLGTIFSFSSFGGDAYVHDIKVVGSNSMNLVITSGNNITVQNCHFERSQRDGVHVSGNKKIIVDKCRFINVCDDSISAIFQPGSHLDTELTITNNFIYKSQGINVGGARNLRVHGNNILYPVVRGIYVGYYSTEAFSDRGPLARWSISIKDNQIQDVLNRNRLQTGVSTNQPSLGSYIMVGDSGHDGNGNYGFVWPIDSIGNNRYVWGANGSGGVVDPLDYMYVADNLVGNISVFVEGNSCIRTLKPAASFDAYGFGPYYIQNVGIYTGSITEDDFLNEHYKIGGTFRGAIISNNISRRAKVAFNIGGPRQVAIPDFQDVVFDGNQVYDYDNDAAFTINLSGVVSFINNIVNGDPVHRSVDRLPNGGWSSTATKVAYKVVNGKVLVKGGTVSNVSAVGIGDINYLEPITVYADMTQIAGSDSNKGVRTLSGVPFNYARQDSDPTSSTFGQTSSITLNYSNAMPTSGNYLAGQFVAATLPIVSGSTLTLGWTRLTTGNGHVLNTDWKAATVTI